MSTPSLSSNHPARVSDWPGLGQVLQAPPHRTAGYADLLDCTVRTPRQQLPACIEGDAASGVFRIVSEDQALQVALEYVRMAPGAWLVFGDLRSAMPHYIWSRERKMRSFSLVLRGGYVIGFAHSPQQRFAVTEGQSLCMAYGAETMTCRTPLPGVRTQAVSIYFEDDDAMQQFGLDVGETQAWLSAGQANAAAPGLRLVSSAPNSMAVKAAQAICWNTYQGARRRLFLRSKAGELMCHLLATSGMPPAGAGIEGRRLYDDASLAALAHEAVSDPEHCPDVMDVAAKLRVTPGRLLAAFRATYGVSLREHMSATRMARARQLLLNTNTPLLEVALACGYEHHSSFSTAYRRSFGVTPIEARRSAFQH